VLPGLTVARRLDSTPAIGYWHAAPQIFEVSIQFTCGSIPATDCNLLDAQMGLQKQPACLSNPDCMEMFRIASAGMFSEQTGEMFGRDSQIIRYYTLAQTRLPVAPFDDPQSGLGVF
jgi:hypothetical protein